MPIGTVFTAFSRKYQDLSSSTKTPTATNSFVEVRFDQWEITMRGNTSGLPGAAIPNWWWGGYKIYDVTGDSGTNANMFVGTSDEPNIVSQSMSSGPGGFGWNIGNLLRYTYENLPAGGTDRTYELRQGVTPIAQLTIFVPGQNAFRRTAEGAIETINQEITQVNHLNHWPVEQNSISGLGHAWHHEHKFVGITPEVSEKNVFGHNSSSIISSHSASSNDIPDLTFYVKENLDSKNTHTDYKFRPDANASYSSNTSDSQQIMAGLLAQYHTANFGYGNSPVIQLNSDTMRRELIDKGVSVDLDSQHLSYLKPSLGTVPETSLSIIIQAENLGSQTAESTLRYANNADYTAILAKHSGGTTYTNNINIPVNGFAIVTQNREGHNPCVNSTLSYTLNQLTHESTSGANDGEIDVTGTGGTAPYTYTWGGPNGFTSTSSTISGLTPGVYSLKIDDDLGCTVSANFTVNPGNTPCNFNISLTQTPSGGCGLIDLSAVVSNLPSGITNYNWKWIYPNGTTSTGNQSNSSTINIDSAVYPGMFIFEVDIGGGCIKSSQISVVAVNTLSLTMSSTDVTTNGGTDGTATVTVTGGATPYTYLWNTGAVTSSITNLSAGTYTVFVTDANGCTDEDSVIVGEPSYSTPTVTPLDVCMDLSTNKFTFTDNQDYIASGTSLPYKIAIIVKLVNNSSTIYSGSLSSPDIFIDNDMASARTYNAATKYGKNTDITILSGPTLYNDIYEITFNWNFSGGTTIEATHTIKLNGLSITTFNAVAISSSITYDCNDDIINSLDITNYSVNNVPYSFTRTHSLSPPAGSSLSSPVLSSSASALNYTGLEVGVWSNSIVTDIIWDFPGTANYQEYCIIQNLTYTNNKNVLCDVDPCVVTECIEKVRAKLDRAECNCDENDIKKYRHILKRVGHLLAMYDITLVCSNIIDDPTLLYDIIDLTDCGCDCECGGCD
jgi:hypothetical protein